MLDEEGATMLEEINDDSTTSELVIIDETAAVVSLEDIFLLDDILYELNKTDSSKVNVELDIIKSVVIEASVDKPVIDSIDEVIILLDDGFSCKLDDSIEELGDIEKLELMTSLDDKMPLEDDIIEAEASKEDE